MGRRGPAPRPTVLRVLEGNPGKRPLNKREPRPRIVTPRPPAHLDARARAYWDELVPELERVPGLLTAVDGTALAAYCQACSEWEQADIAIQEHGLTTDTGHGIFARPEVRIRDTAAKRMKAFAAEFGLTPSSRSRIQVGHSQDDSDSDGILS
jgi:P27 family predicted phage terminase small subunit